MKIIKKQNGYALLIVLLTITIIGIISVPLFNQIMTTTVSVEKVQANIKAEGPIEVIRKEKDTTDTQPPDPGGNENPGEVEEPGVNPSVPVVTIPKGGSLPCKGGNKNKDLKGGEVCTLTGPIVITDQVTLAGKSELIINGDVTFLGGALIQGTQGKITINKGKLTVDYKKVSGNGSIYVNNSIVWKKGYKK
ncbi:hypothetical protein UACE39S_05324 [Ureibacillus acetophenoni]